MVVELTGSWEDGIMRILKYIAYAAAVRSGEDAGWVFTTFLQEFIVVIRSNRVRVALRRRAEHFLSLIRGKLL